MDDVGLRWAQSHLVDDHGYKLNMQLIDLFCRIFRVIGLTLTLVYAVCEERVGILYQHKINVFR